MRKAGRAAIVGLSIMLGVLVPGVANATPPSGVTGTIISTTIVGNTEYIVRQITIAPGGSTGWHYHDGTLYAFVQEGTLTHTESDCTTVMSYRTGSAFEEVPGANHVHIGRNLGTTPVILDVLYVLPNGAPLSEDAPNPGCSFQ